MAAWFNAGCGALGYLELYFQSLMPLQLLAIVQDEMESSMYDFFGNSNWPQNDCVKCTGTTGMSVNGLGADQRGGGYQVRVHQVKAPSAALCHWGLKDDSNVLGWQCFESWMIRLTWKLFQFEEIQRHSFCDANFRSVLKFEKEKTQNSMEIPTVG